MTVWAVVQACSGPVEDLFLHDEGDGKPISWVLDALKRVKGVDGILLAVPESGPTEGFASLASLHGVKFFAGPENPLQRLLAAGERYGFAAALRVSSNMVFIDPALSDALLLLHAREGADFSHGAGYPRGVVPEVISLKALRTCGPAPDAAYASLLGGAAGKQARLRCSRDYALADWKARGALDLDTARAVRRKMGEARHDFAELETALPDILAGLLMAAENTERKRHFNLRLWEIEASLMSPRVRAVPTQVRIEPNPLCNIHCITCPHHFTKVPENEFNSLFAAFPPENLLAYSTYVKDNRGFYVKNSLPFSEAVFERVRDELYPYARTANFGTYGEALLNPRTPAYIRQAKDAGLFVYMISNGTLLTEQKARELIAAGLGWICVSFDGASREVYEGIRQGADYGLVSGNVKRLARLKRELGVESPVIQLAFTASARNIREFPELVRLAGEWGVNVVDTNVCFFTNHMDPKDALYFYRDLTRENIARAKEAAARNGITLTMTTSMDSFINGRVRDEYCRLPWAVVSIAGTGNVQMCGCKYVEEAGNMMESGFMAVMNSPKFVAFREGLRDKSRMHPSCMECFGGITEPPNPSTFMCGEHRKAMGLEAAALF